MEKVIAIKLQDGGSIYAKADFNNTSGIQDVGRENFSINMEDIKNNIIQIGTHLGQALKTISPDKASIEFGLEVGFNEGKAVSLFIGGSATTSIKVCLEWNRSEE